MSSTSNPEARRASAAQPGRAFARRYHRARPLRRRRSQQGLTLVELMVGLLLALFCIATAIAILASSRSISGSVTELSVLQQQASFAMRVMGMQFRQAGALDLVQTPGTQLYGFPGGLQVVPATQVEVGGTDGGVGKPDTITVATQPASGLPQTQNRNCLAEPITAGDPMLSTFSVADGSLRCTTQKRAAGGLSAASTQPVISNVADFQVRFRVTIPGASYVDDTTQVMTAADVTAASQWPLVRAIEICLDMQATESTPDAGATYVACDGSSRSLNKHVHLVYRNVFEMRVKGTV